MQIQTEQTGMKPRVGAESTGEVEIRKTLHEFSDAVASGDLERIMSFFDNTMVSYDMPPPLRIANKSESRQSWEKWFTSQFQFPVNFEFREVQVFCDGDVGFSHGLIHMSGTFKETGEVTHCWMRHTAGFRKKEGNWLVVHDHTSVPLAEDGRGMMDLAPEGMPTH